jgi:hypothetical protein
VEYSIGAQYQLPDNRWEIFSKSAEYKTGGQNITGIGTDLPPVGDNPEESL